MSRKVRLQEDASIDVNVTVAEKLTDLPKKGRMLEEVPTDGTPVKVFQGRPFIIRDSNGKEKEVIPWKIIMRDEETPNGQSE